MSNNIEENELVLVAMNIILHAGDARTKVQSALDLLKVKDFNGAKNELVEAKDKIRLAHASQTEVIQNETRGVHYEPCLLFTHAQDTLMTINSEYLIASQMVDLFESFLK